MFPTVFVNWLLQLSTNITEITIQPVANAPVEDSGNDEDMPISKKDDTVTAPHSVKKKDMNSMFLEDAKCVGKIYIFILIIHNYVSIIYC